MFLSMCWAVRRFPGRRFHCVRDHARLPLVMLTAPRRKRQRAQSRCKCAMLRPSHMRHVFLERCTCTVESTKLIRVYVSVSRSILVLCRHLRLRFGKLLLDPALQSFSWWIQHSAAPTPTQERLSNAKGNLLDCRHEHPIPSTLRQEQCEQDVCVDGRQTPCTLKPRAPERGMAKLRALFT